MKDEERVRTFGGVYSHQEIEEIFGKSRNLSLSELLSKVDKFQGSKAFSIQSRIDLCLKAILNLTHSIPEGTRLGNPLNPERIVKDTNTDTKSLKVGTVESKIRKHPKDLSGIICHPEDLLAVKQIFELAYQVISRLGDDLVLSQTSHGGVNFFSPGLVMFEEKAKRRDEELAELEKQRKSNAYFSRQRRQKWYPRSTKTGKEILRSFDRNKNKVPESELKRRTRKRSLVLVPNKRS